MTIEKIKNAKRIRVYSILDGKYYLLNNNNNHFSNNEIEIPINWISYENRFIAQDPYLKDSLYVIIKILE